MEKINGIFAESKIYNKLKSAFLFLCACFRDTFFYKLFFSDINEETLQKSLFGRFFKAVKSFFDWIYDVFSDVFVVKLLKKIFSFDWHEIIRTSEILRFFHVNDYKYSFSFLICLATLLTAGFLPTMVVAGLCILSCVMMFFESDFSVRLKKFKPVATDLFIFAYLIALFHARNISIDYQRNRIFLIYCVFVGVYFVFRYYLSDVNKVKMASSAFAASGLFVCAYGMIQFLTGSYKTTTWTDTNMFSDIEGRLVATFENPNVFGEYLLFLIPLAVALFFLTDKFIWKLIYFGAAIGGCLCMVLTYSRGCWIGLMLGMFVFVLMLYPKILLPVCLIAPFSLFFIPESIMTRITSIGNLQDGSTAFRVFLWKSTIDMVKDVWYTGIGLGTSAFTENYRPYSYEAVVAPHSHNTFLHVLCESGIFGLAVFVLLLYFTLRQLFVSYRQTQNKTVKILAAAFVSGLLGLLVQAMFDNTLYNYRMYMLFFAVISSSAALYSVRREKLD